MNNERILIVEDDLDIIELCRTVLEQDGYILDEAAKGKRALDLLSQNSYNLLLIDLNLPDIKGMEILKTVRMKYQNTDVIIMTGEGSDDLRKEALQSGAYDYIPKPFSSDEMCLLVKHCLEKQKLTGDVNKFKQEVDITQDKLVQSEKRAAMSVVVGYIAHELRKPLANIKTVSQFCLNSKTMTLDEKVKDRLEIVLGNVERAGKIISDTLAFSQPVKISVKTGSINEILEKVCRSFESEDIQQVKIIRKFSQKLPLIKFDYDNVERAFVNIIQNSLQAMSYEGNLTIETAKNEEEKKIVIKFIDTGCGISSEVISQIFNPFFTRRDGGIGLGLSLTKEIIELHGGRISAESREGEGAAFSVAFPIEP